VVTVENLIMRFSTD